MLAQKMKSIHTYYGNKIMEKKAAILYVETEAGTNTRVSRKWKTVEHRREVTECSVDDERGSRGRSGKDGELVWLSITG